METVRSTSPSASVASLAKQFRRASTAVRIPLRDRLRYWLSFVALAYRGKPAFSAERDAVYADGFFARRYARATERINARLAALPAQEAPLEVPVFDFDKLQRKDLELLTKLRIPYVLRGAANGLPVMDWTLESLEEGWGDHTGPINEATDEPSSDLDLPTKAHHYYDFRIGTLREVAASIRADGPKRFVVAEDVMHTRDGQLRRELDIPHWERISGWAQNQHRWLRSRLFVGKVFSAQLLMQPKSAFSLWHTEPGDNLFVLARGNKTWTLAHPTYTPAMRPRVKKTTNYTGSNIDLREPDEVQRSRGFAGYLGIPKVRAKLQAGDMLRVPSFWWHSVETSPDTHTIASSMRVESGPSLVAPGLLLMRLLDKQTHAIIKAFQTDGRISDSLIGQPRKSRSMP